MRKRWNPLSRAELAVEIGARIRRLRQNRGWNQATLASKLEIPEKSIQQYEKGDLPPLYTLYQLSGVFEVDLGDLLSDLPKTISKARAAPFSVEETLSRRKRLSAADREALTAFIGVLLDVWERLRGSNSRRK